MGVNRCSWGPCSREEKYTSTTINHPGVLFLVKDKKHKENEKSIPTQMTTGAAAMGKLRNCLKHYSGDVEVGRAFQLVQRHCGALIIV